MIGRINEYKITEFIKPDKAKVEAWVCEVSKFIFSKIEDQVITLINCETSNLSSIVGEFKSGYVLASFNNKKYEYSIIDNLSDEIIHLIVDSEDFYLGHVCLAVGQLDKNEIENIVIQNSKDLYLAGLPIIKMGFDGNYLYLINL